MKGARGVLGRWAALPGPRAVAGDRRLKVICGTLLLYFHFTFHAWRERAAALSSAAEPAFDFVPPPLLQGWGWMRFLGTFEIRTWMYALGMLSLAGLFALFFRRGTAVALGLLAFLWANKMYFYFATSVCFPTTTTSTCISWRCFWLQGTSCGRCGSR